MHRQLTIIAGPETGNTYSLRDGQMLTIGRGQASDTRINDPRMSRVHCRVQIDGGKTLLVDNGSSAGTLVRGDAVSQHELKPGEVFQVGDTQFRYQLEGHADATTLTGERAFGRAPSSDVIAPLKNLVGQSLAHYRLDSILSMDESGTVFKSHDTQHDRVAAVKVLTPDPSRGEEQKERFVRAMKTMLPVKHPHIVRLYSAGKNGPYCWAAMEYIDGESMTEVIQRIGVEGMLDWREVFRVSVHIGRALYEAHKQKIIHRNVTPANIIRRHSDKTCLLGDLMLAKALEGAQARQVTQPGQFVGDVAYMSPERTRESDDIDHRSDIYGLGATLYALLTAKPPFESLSLPALVRMVRDDEPKKPKEFQFSVNELFQDLVLKMLAKNPEDRCQTPGELLKELDRIARYNSLTID